MGASCSTLMEKGELAVDLGGGHRRGTYKMWWVKSRIKFSDTPFIKGGVCGLSP